MEELGTHLLIRSPNWLGDAIMAMPTIHQVFLQKSTNTEVSILCAPKLKDLWRCWPHECEIITASPSLRETSKTLRDKKISSVIVLPNSLRTGLEVFLAGIPKRYGYHGHLRRLLFTKTFENSNANPKKKKIFEHQKHDYLRLIQFLGFEIPINADLPVVPKPKNNPLDEKYLAVCPGAEYGPTKRWLPERFAEVAKTLASEHGFKIVILGAKSDQETANFVEQHLTPCINVAGKTSLKEFIRYIAHASLVLCNDSGAMHLATLFRTPGVAIFGSTEHRLTGPMSDKMRVVREQVDCSPCFLRQCPIDMRCMNRVIVDQVLVQAKKALAMS